MNVADTALVDLALRAHVRSLPTRKRKHGRTESRRRYLPENRLRKKREREARKRNRP